MKEKVIYLFNAIICTIYVKLATKITNLYHQFDLYDIIYLISVNDENDANYTTTEEIDEILDKENEVPAKKQKRTKTGIDK